HPGMRFGDAGRPDRHVGRGGDGDGDCDQGSDGCHDGCFHQAKSKQLAAAHAQRSQRRVVAGRDEQLPGEDLSDDEQSADRGEEGRAVAGTTSSRVAITPTTLNVTGRPLDASTPDAVVGATMACKTLPAWRWKASAKFLSATISSGRSGRNIRPSATLGLSIRTPMCVSAATKSWNPAPSDDDPGVPGGALAPVTNASTPTPTPTSAT